MFFTRILLLFITFMGMARTVSAQGDFCEAVNAIMHDAPEKFRNVKGDNTGANMSAHMWACTIKVPGTINSRFVSAMGLFYEGALLQTKNKDDVKAMYDKYKELLTACLTSQGYTLTTQANFYPGMDAYKKLAFMPKLTDAVKPGDAPPHVTMEATYNKTIDLYTLVFYIFEH